MRLFPSLGALGLLCASFAAPAHAAGIRQPLGVYVHVDAGDAIAAIRERSPLRRLHAYLQNFYAGLLADPAIAGITFGAHWDQTQPSSGTAPSSFDWSYLDDVFTAASAAQKTVQLIMTPGVDSPAWLMAEMPSCDPLFTKGERAGQLRFGYFRGVSGAAAGGYQRDSAAVEHGIPAGVDGVPDEPECALRIEPGVGGRGDCRADLRVGRDDPADERQYHGGAAFRAGAGRYVGGADSKLVPRRTRHTRRATRPSSMRGNRRSMRRRVSSPA